MKDLIRNRPELFILFAVFIPAACIAGVIYLLVQVSDIQPLDLCKQKCYPNDTFGYSIKENKCVCDMRKEYRELK